MKKLITLNLVLICLTGPALAAEPQEVREEIHTDALLISPFVTTVGAVSAQAPTFLVEYQHSFGSKLGLIANGIGIIFPEGDGMFGLIETGPRFLLTGENLDGLYLFPFAGIAFAIPAASQLGFLFDLGAEFGYSWTFHNGFMVNINAGFCFFLSPAGEAAVDIIIPRVGFNLGYSW
jgi:hypothetical protein